MVGLSLVERIVHWIQPAFLAAGYVIIAGGVLMERSIFIGLIIPGDVILALGGVYAAQHKMSLAWVIVIGTFAGTLKFANGAKFTLTGAGYDVFVVKFDPAGTRKENGA